MLLRSLNVRFLLEHSATWILGSLKFPFSDVNLCWLIPNWKPQYSAVAIGEDTSEILSVLSLLSLFISFSCSAKRAFSFRIFSSVLEQLLYLSAFSNDTLRALEVWETVDVICWEISPLCMSFEADTLVLQQPLASSFDFLSTFSLNQYGMSSDSSVS